MTRRVNFFGSCERVIRTLRATMRNAHTMQISREHLDNHATDHSFTAGLGTSVHRPFARKDHNPVRGRPRMGSLVHTARALRRNQRGSG